MANIFLDLKQVLVLMKNLFYSRDHFTCSSVLHINSKVVRRASLTKFAQKEGQEYYSPVSVPKIGLNTPGKYEFALW